MLRRGKAPVKFKGREGAEMRREMMANLKDKKLQCKICGDSFAFTTGEQIFYRDRGLAEPRRCPDCRRNHRLAIFKEKSGAENDYHTQNP